MMSSEELLKEVAKPPESPRLQVEISGSGVFPLP